jgi:AraC-like DNA-binding protein
MRIEIADEQNFAAHWSSRGVGPLRMLTLAATPQRVVHAGDRGGSHPDPTFQLLYCTRAALAGRVGAEPIRLEAGDCVLIDNAQPYDLSMEDHEAIDIVMPFSWLERWLPDPAPTVARPIPTATGWARPLGSFLHAMADELDSAALPRISIAEQVGPLLALALGHQPTAGTGHRTRLLGRTLRLIEERHGDPELDPARVAAALGISKRHLHAVLAAASTTFVETLGRVRLDRACEMLAHRRFAQLQIGEIAWRCGYADPSYFARVFRRRFGMGPRDWRSAQLR